MRYVLATAALFFAAVGICHGEDEPVSAKPDQGWYFYEKEVEKEPPKLVPEKKQESVAKAAEPVKKKPMTAAWLKEMLPKLQEKAIDNPTQENVAAYAYALRVMTDKAQRYTDVHADLIKTDPFLNLNNTLPFNGAQRDLILSKAGESRRTALKEVAKKTAGLFVFFDSKCSYCKTQIGIVSNVAKRNGFELMYVSVDGKGLPGASGWVSDNGTAKMLGIKTYPTTILAIPPKTYIPISFGLMAEDQLEDTLLAASKAAKLISDELLKDINPYERGVLTLEDMQDGAYDDPEKFVRYLKEKLNNRY